MTYSVSYVWIIIVNVLFFLLHQNVNMIINLFDFMLFFSVGDVKIIKKIDKVGEATWSEKMGTNS